MLSVSTVEPRWWIVNVGLGCGKPGIRYHISKAVIERWPPPPEQWHIPRWLAFLLLTGLKWKEEEMTFIKSVITEGSCAGISALPVYGMDVSFSPDS